jgi:hypothetical protein
MGENYIKVDEEDDGEGGTIMVYDTADTFHTDFDYSGKGGRIEARRQAVELAQQKADELGCEWGSNFPPVFS